MKDPKLKKEVLELKSHMIVVIKDLCKQFTTEFDANKNIDYFDLVHAEKLANAMDDTIDYMDIFLKGLE